MNIKLKNLRSAEEDLGRFLGNVVVTSELATSICGDEVSDVYLEYVIELNNKVLCANFVAPQMFGDMICVPRFANYAWKMKLNLPAPDLILVCFEIPIRMQIKYLGQSQAAPDGSSLDMPPSRTMAAKGVQPHLENLKAKVGRLCSWRTRYRL